MQKTTGQTMSEKKYNINPEKDFDLCNVASSTDLTGLKPFAIHSNEALGGIGSLLLFILFIL